MHATSIFLPVHNNFIQDGRKQQETVETKQKHLKEVLPSSKWHGSQTHANQSKYQALLFFPPFHFKWRRSNDDFCVHLTAQIESSSRGTYQS